METTLKQPTDVTRQLFWVGIVSLIGVQVLLVSLLVDARTISTGSALAYAISFSGDALKWCITSVAIFSLFIIQNRQKAEAILSGGTSLSRLYWAVPIQLLCYGVFLAVTAYLFSDVATPSNTQLGVWLLLVLVVGLAYLNLISTAKNIGLFIVEFKTALLVSLLAGFAVLAISILSRQLWEPLSSFTMHGSHLLLGLVYQDLFIEASEKLLGANGFIVHIAPVCSGIDGVALALGITGTYLYFSRATLKFPHAFLLLPIAALLSLLLNVVRVASLIAIGASISEELAIEGFHSVAGWIASVLIAMIIIFVFSAWPYFQKENARDFTGDKNVSTEAKLATAILTPFVLFMGCTLVAGIFKSDFDYLYPIKILLPCLALIWCFRSYRLSLPRNLIEPLAIGTLVAVLWILLIPADPEANSTFSRGLFSMPTWAVFGWISFRIIGFWIFAPIVEELVFRCYLLNRITGTSLQTDGRIAFSAIAFMLSSVLFGSLHADWFAGVIAGALFAVARYRSDSVSSPIIAHACANILVGVWAIATQNWILL